MKESSNDNMLQAGKLRSDRVLKNVREALIDRNDVADCDIAAAEADGTTPEDLSVAFAQSFTQSGGTMYYCLNEQDIRQRLEEIQRHHDDIVLGCASENLTSFLGHIGMQNCCTCDPTKLYPLGATLCEALIAWNGGIVISSNLGLGNKIPALPETAANERLKDLYKEYPEQIIVTSPNSYAYRRGMQKLYLLLIEDETN